MHACVRTRVFVCLSLYAYVCVYSQIFSSQIRVIHMTVFIQNMHIRRKIRDTFYCKWESFKMAANARVPLYSAGLLAGRC